MTGINFIAKVTFHTRRAEQTCTLLGNHHFIHIFLENGFDIWMELYLIQCQILIILLVIVSLELKRIPRHSCAVLSILILFKTNKPGAYLFLRWKLSFQNSKIRNFGKLFKFITSTLSCFDLGSITNWSIVWVIMGRQGVSSERRCSSCSSPPCHERPPVLRNHKTKWLLYTGVTVLKSMFCPIIIIWLHLMCCLYVAILPIVAIIMLFYKYQWMLIIINICACPVNWHVFFTSVFRYKVSFSLIPVSSFLSTTTYMKLHNSLTYSTKCIMKLTFTVI